MSVGSRVKVSSGVLVSVSVGEEVKVGVMLGVGVLVEVGKGWKGVYVGVNNNAVPGVLLGSLIGGKTTFFCELSM